MPVLNQASISSLIAAASSSSTSSTSSTAPTTPTSTSPHATSSATSTPKDSSVNHTGLGIGLGVGLGILVLGLTVAGLLVCLRQRHRRQNRLSSQATDSDQSRGQYPEYRQTPDHQSGDRKQPLMHPHPESQRPIELDTFSSPKELPGDQGWKNVKYQQSAGEESDKKALDSVTAINQTEGAVDAKELSVYRD